MNNAVFKSIFKEYLFFKEFLLQIFAEFKKKNKLHEKAFSSSQLAWKLAYKYLNFKFNEHRLSPRNLSDSNALANISLVYHLILGRYFAAQRLKKYILKSEAFKETNLSSTQQDFIINILEKTTQSDSNYRVVGSIIESNIEILDYTFQYEFNNWLKASFKEIEEENNKLLIKIKSAESHNNIVFIISCLFSWCSNTRRLLSYLDAINNVNSMFLNFYKGSRSIYHNIYQSNALICLNFLENTTIFNNFTSFAKESIENSGRNEFLASASFSLTKFLTHFPHEERNILEWDIWDYPSMLTSDSFWKRMVAIGYLRSPDFEKEENLEKARILYEELLSEVTKFESLHTRHGLTHILAFTYFDLGILYRTLQSKTKREKGKNLSLSIKNLEKAIKIYIQSSDRDSWGMNTRLAGLMYSHLGTVYLNEHTERAIKYLCYAESLLFGSRDIAEVKRKLGTAYKEKGIINLKKKRKARKDFESAIIYFSESLNTFSPDDDPQECLETSRSLGELNLFYLKDYKSAINAYEIAIKAVESNRKWIFSDQYKQQWQDESSDVYQKIVKACINDQQYPLALEYIERSKLNHLKELLAEQYLYSEYLNSNLKDSKKINDLHRDIVAIQKQLETKTKNSCLDNLSSATFLHEKLYALRKELKDSIADILDDKTRQIISEEGNTFDFTEFQSSLNENVAIIEWFILDDSLLTFLITRDKVKKYQSTQSELNLLNIWLKEYIESNNSLLKESWKNRFEAHLEKLSHILCIKAILDEISENVNQLILVPYRLLHILPLHALPLISNDSKTCLMDRFSEGVRYVPSCQMLQKTSKQNKQVISGFFGVQDPTEDLLFARLQVQEIANSFESSVVANEKSATKDFFTSTVKKLKKPHCLHFACHGKFEEKSPLKSYLKLAQSEHLTLGEIFGLNLEHCPLVILSACETGVTDYTCLSDEYTGLPSGFLFAGSSYIVSTLWKVDEIATALLMIKFYMYISLHVKHNGSNLSDIARYLRNAQIWLKSITHETLKTDVLPKYEGQINQLLTSTTKGKKSILRASITQALERKPLPFVNPYYWAGFIVTGQ